MSVARDKAEKALGRSLRYGEDVHHIDRNPTNNRNNNLLVCTRAYHALIHKRMNNYDRTGSYTKKVCQHCKCAYDPQSIAETASHKACASQAAADRRWRKIINAARLSSGAS